VKLEALGLHSVYVVPSICQTRSGCGGDEANAPSPTGLFMSFHLRIGRRLLEIKQAELNSVCFYAESTEAVDNVKVKRIGDERRRHDAVCAQSVNGAR